jgi:uncharacterized damage-inducible protein DinB
MQINSNLGNTLAKKGSALRVAGFVMNSESTSLTESLIAEFQRGIALINQIDDDTYASRPDNSASIGAHFRHNLDFVVNFLNGLEKHEIDYCARERDTRVEQHREYAISVFEQIIKRLSGIDDADKKILRIRSEVQEDLWSDSSVLRELEFVHSHTVHHYALIAAKLRSLDVELPREFGVAPSTLRYWNSEKSNATGA